MVKNINVYLIFIIILLIIFICYIKSSSLKIVEPLNLNHPNFLKEYPKYNFKINHDKKELTHNNSKTLKYKDINSLQSRKIMNNKNKTTEFLKQNNIPVPKTIKFINTKNNLDNLDNQLKISQLNYPLVVKPENGQQGKGVYLNHSSFEQLKETIVSKLNKYKKLTIQEQVEGINYRILIVNHKIIYVLEKPYPYVIGNGKDTIKQLIDIRNETQKRNKKFPTIYLDEKYIKSQGYTLDSVLPINQKIIITNLINSDNGSNLIIFPIDEIHKDNLDLFLKISSIIDFTICGIDFIIPDIRKSYKDIKNKGYILELNSVPAYPKYLKKNKLQKITNNIVSQLDSFFRKNN